MVTLIGMGSLCTLACLVASVAIIGGALYGALRRESVESP